MPFLPPSCLCKKKTKIHKILLPYTCEIPQGRYLASWVSVPSDDHGHERRLVVLFHNGVILYFDEFAQHTIEVPIMARSIQKIHLITSHESGLIEAQGTTPCSWSGETLRFAYFWVEEALKEMWMQAFRHFSNPQEELFPQVEIQCLENRLLFVGGSTEGNVLQLPSAVNPIDDSRILLIRNRTHMPEMDPEEFNLLHTILPVNPVGKNTQVDVKMFRTVGHLGRGTFGDVDLVQKKDAGQLFALKKFMMLKDETVKKNVQLLLTERRVLTKLQNSFFPTLFCAFLHEEKTYLILEYAPGGSLRDRIGSGMTMDEVQFYAAELVYAIGYLHEKKIIHRDIKPDNMLIDANGHIKLIDMGFCQENVRQETLCSDGVGTAYYAAPELFKKRSYTLSVDWWALGVSLFEMLHGRLPFEGRTIQELRHKVSSLPPVTVSWPDPVVRDFILGLIKKHPIARLQYEDCKTHIFLKFINFDKVMNKRYPAPFKPTVNYKFSEVEPFDYEPIPLTPKERKKFAYINTAVAW